jgi:competence/damage-inducible protein CinA-like protein
LTDRPRAAVLLTGSELVRGAKADANGAFLARELTRLGLEPSRLVVVGDRVDELEAALREALAADLAVVSGGLGPTHDDRTVELLARTTGKRLIVDAGLEREIEAVARRIAQRLDRPYADFAAGVRKQASLPEGGLSLGLAGTAPAVVLEHDRGVAVVLPGPPGELRRLWPAALASEPVRRVLARAAPRQHRVLRFFGPSESAVARALDETGGETGGVEVTVCAADLEIQVDVFAPEAGSSPASALAEALRARFGEELFAEDERSVAELVLERCRALGLTLATAESCTGGLVGARLTDVPGASDVYLGGVVAYANDVKAGALGVSEEVLSRYGAVSAEAARALAHGVRAALAADVSLAVTGVAGPGGGTPAKPVGLVFLHVVSPHGELERELRLPGDRTEIRTRATVAGLHLVRALLTRSARDLRDDVAYRGRR